MKHTVYVYTIIVRICYTDKFTMKNITLSADERLIKAAREKAQSNRTTLNAEFRQWLKRYAQKGGQAEQNVQAYRRIMDKLAEVSTEGEQFSRADLNER